MGKYFKYAIGEIILVVIGILIALQVSNWNDQRLQNNKMNSYYLKLLDEVKDKKSLTNERMNREIELQEQIAIVIEILSNKDYDRISEFKENLGALATAWGPEYSFYVFEEFIAQGLLSHVKSKKLKTALTILKEKIELNKEIDNYVDNQYVNLIEPYFSKNINYAEVALPQYKENLKQGGPDVNYEELFNSLELWNVATFKLETTNLNIKDYERTNRILDSVQKRLEALNLKTK